MLSRALSFLFPRLAKTSCCLPQDLRANMYLGKRLVEGGLIGMEERLERIERIIMCIICIYKIPKKKT
jgi:hypothetical protein